MFVIIVVTIDLPSLRSHLGERLFWTLTVRELAFGGGAMVLAGSVWPRQSLASSALISVGRVIVAGTLIFYGIQHFLFPLFAPGVPLEKVTPPWVLFPVPLAYIVGLIQSVYWDRAFRPSNDPHRRCYRLDHASATHNLFIRAYSRTGDQH
jgi:hypothetical protein